MTTRSPGSFAKRLCLHGAFISRLQLGDFRKRLVAQLLEQIVRNGLGDVRPGVDDLVVALAVEELDETTAIEEEQDGTGPIELGPGPSDG